MTSRDLACLRAFAANHPVADTLPPDAVRSDAAHALDMLDVLRTMDPDGYATAERAIAWSLVPNA